MFRQIAAIHGIDEILSGDARVLAYLMDWFWHNRVRGADTAAFSPPPAPIGVAIKNVFERPGAYLPPHLIYAYCVEATGVMDALAAVVRQFTTSERLGIAQNPATYQWLATTEELFFRDGGPFTPFPTTSRLRADVDLNRRNAYFRMFGMDLPVRDGRQPPAYDKPAAANREFVATFELLLREVWRAIENVSNQIGPNATDREAIRDLVTNLQDMLLARRGGTRSSPFGPNLAREEFLYVCALSWMHLTIEANTSIVEDLRATAPSADGRLRIIGERVGVATHRQARSFLILADAMAILLTNIEIGTHSTVPGADALWQPGTASDTVRQIITHWSKTTGRDIKAPGLYAPARPTQVAPVGASATTAIPPAGSGAGGSNGSLPVAAAAT